MNFAPCLVIRSTAVSELSQVIGVIMGHDTTEKLRANFLTLRNPSQ